MSITFFLPSPPLLSSPPLPSSPPLSPNQPTRYSGFFSSLVSLLSGVIEPSAFMNECRETFGVHSFHLFPLDAVLNAIGKGEEREPWKEGEGTEEAGGRSEEGEEAGRTEGEVLTVQVPGRRRREEGVEKKQGGGRARKKKQEIGEGTGRFKSRNFRK
jgi:hypothetical protein